MARSSWRSARPSEQRKRSLPRPVYLRRPCGTASVRLHPPRVVPGHGARTATDDDDDHYDGRRRRQLGRPTTATGDDDDTCDDQ